MTQDEIITAARECLGTPFRHQGRIVGSALDCAGVAIHVASYVGMDVQDVRGYGRVPLNGQLEKMLESQSFLSIVRREDIQAGDILLMRFTSEPQHLAIFTGENIVHAYEAVGKCVEHRLDTRWRTRIVRGYRFSEVSQ